MRIPLTAGALVLIGVHFIQATPPSLTIYNQNFAVVRETVPLDLKAGVNEVRFPGAAALLEPDSVILRDPSGATTFSVLEQSFWNNPVSEGLLLDLHEGKSVDFRVQKPGQPDRIVSGKIIRSGYTPAQDPYFNRYGMDGYNAGRTARMNGAANQPIIETEGVLYFSLPGVPLFPPLEDDAILKPTLHWRLQCGAPVKVDAQLGYLTDGIGWEADYNVVAEEESEVLTINGWVTMTNQCGKDFADARIQLIAGDVRKLRPDELRQRAAMMASSQRSNPSVPGVTERGFDEYHLYTLERPATLHDRESKQVEFVRAEGVQSQRIYVYDGAKVDWQRSHADATSFRGDSSFGADSHNKVWVMSEFMNSAANQLGIPLPRGRVRFYRQEGERLQFIGENVIDHTPRDMLLRIYTGDAYDLRGERRRTQLKSESSDRWADETFEFKLANRKREPVEIRVIEHLYRAVNWDISQSSNTFLKTDAQSIEFRIPLKPDEERTVSYTVHYSW
ncbi:MAG: DUF4139 domain-containing protein [Chthoniobacteraceae bacterium]